MNLTPKLNLINLNRVRELLMSGKCGMMRVRDSKYLCELSTKEMRAEYFKHLHKANTRVMRNIKHTYEDKTFHYSTNSFL